MPRLAAAVCAMGMLAASCVGGGDDITVDGKTSPPAGSSVDGVEPSTPPASEQPSTSGAVEAGSTSEPDEAGTTSSTDVEATAAPLIDRPLADPVTVLAVSDLADCRGPDAEVAELVRSLEGTIIMAGDLANREGSQQQFDECFLPLYGSELDRILAVPGDNDYNTPGAGPYYGAMDDLPGDTGQGWYAVEIGSWQLIALNSNCDQVGGCRAGSEQYQWLDELLKQKSYDCRIVMWHEPRFTSAANYSGIPRLADFYGRLHGAGADIVVVGHSHHYERLGPLAPNGKPDPGGLMNFTIGTGGSFFTEFGDPRAGSRVRSNEHRGLVRFTLGSGGYDWEFLNVESNDPDLVDTGSADC